jgi:hypothetical protein
MQSSNTIAAVRLGVAIAGILAASAASAFDIESNDWKFSVDGNINVHYIYSSCESSDKAVAITTVGGACTATPSGTSVSNVGNGLLPAAITFGLSTTQEGFDISAHFGLYPGIASNDGGSPNLQSTTAANNVGLATTGLDVRQVYMTFGNKDIGTFTLGTQFRSVCLRCDHQRHDIAGCWRRGIGFDFLALEYDARIDRLRLRLRGYARADGLHHAGLRRFQPHRRHLRSPEHADGARWREHQQPEEGARDFTPRRPTPINSRTI